jgi:hypothetical protein
MPVASPPCPHARHKTTASPYLIHSGLSPEQALLVPTPVDSSQLQSQGVALELGFSYCDFSRLWFRRDELTQMGDGSYCVTEQMEQATALCDISGQRYFKHRMVQGFNAQFDNVYVLPDAVSNSLDWYICCACSTPHHANYSLITGDDRRLCDLCYDDGNGEWHTCEHTEEIFHEDDMVYRYGDWYHVDHNPDVDQDLDDPDDPSMCKSSFIGQKIATVSLGVLSEEVRYEMEMPAGTVDAVGRKKINSLLSKGLLEDIHKLYDEYCYEQYCKVSARTREVLNEINAVVMHDCPWEDVFDEKRLKEITDLVNSLSSEPTQEWDWRWQNRKGNLTKRLVKLFKRAWNISIDPCDVAEIGNIARAHSEGVKYSFELTRDLNRPAHQFYHSDSCWWTCHAESRCYAKQNGTIGLRTFEGERVTGRVWLVPLRLALGPQKKNTGIIWENKARSATIGISSHPQMVLCCPDHVSRSGFIEVSGEFCKGERAHISTDINQMLRWGRDTWNTDRDEPEPIQGWLVYNGYSGNASNPTRAFAALWAQVMGMTYSQVELNRDNSQVYVNKGAHFLVTSPDLIVSTQSLTIDWSRTCDCEF